MATDGRGPTFAQEPAPQLDELASDVNGPVVVPTPPQETASGPMRGARGRPGSGKIRGSWPLMLALAWWPLWWALGLSQVVFILAAVPLAWQLLQRRRVTFPPGFLLWVLFLILVVFSSFALNADAAGTATPSGAGRYFAYALRLANYSAITVVLLYIGNATERELPRRSLIQWLGVLGASAIALGVLSLAFPDLEWTSPVAHLLPEALADRGVNRLAQVQPVLGEASPRPAAPFTYTNAWGNNTALLMVWLVVAYAVGSARRRLLLALLLVAAVPPVIYSLNRGMWLGLCIAAAVVAVRLAMRGRLAPVVWLAGLSALLVLAFAVSPLGSLVNERLETGHSNQLRGSLASSAVDVAMQSPIIGFGSTRDTIGSESSIAVGPTPECPQCGGRVIGSTGQYTLLLVAQGFVGVLLYVSFLLVALWAFRSDHSPIGIAGWAVLLMQIFFGFFYAGLTMPLAIVFCSFGLLWRNAQVRAGEAG